MGYGSDGMVPTIPPCSYTGDVGMVCTYVCDVRYATFMTELDRGSCSRHVQGRTGGHPNHKYHMVW